MELMAFVAVLALRAQTPLKETAGLALTQCVQR
jgi:hypothetical protein